MLTVDVNSRHDFLWDTDTGEHYFAYKTQLIAIDKSSLRESTILTIMQFIMVREGVLGPIFQLVTSIKQTKKKNAPVISQYESKDQIGVLTQAYNELILDSFQKQQQLAEARQRSVAASKAKS